MKHKSLLMMMLLFAVFGVAKAQVTIGNLETAANDTYLPMNSLYKYSFSEQIYTAEEIGTAGTISSITMWLYGNSDLYEMPFNIYMVETDKEVFDNNTDWIALTDGDLVYSGSVTVHNTTAEAYTFELSSPFEYSGTENLVICFQNNTGSWKGGLNGKVFGAFSDPMRSIYARRDEAPYNLGNLGTAYATTPLRNVIEIGIAGGSVVTCDKPDSVEVSYITHNGAWLSWAGGSGTYNVQYKGATDSDWIDVLTNTTATSYNITGLTPMSYYNARVQCVCSDATSGWKSVTFSTSAGIPLIEEFSGTSIPNGWAQYTGLLEDVLSDSITLTSASYGWSFGAGNGVFDNHARVNIYGTGCMRWLVLPSLSMENNVQLSFEVAYTAYSGTGAAPATSGEDDKFVVLINSNDTWSVLRQWDNAGSSYVLNDLGVDPQLVNIDLSSYAGQNITVALYAESTVANADNNLHIDNLSIDYIPSCYKPTNLAVSDIFDNSVVVTWVSDANQWNLRYKKVSDETWTAKNNLTATTYTLTGLDAVSAYEVQVQTNCGASDGLSEWTNSVTFNTAFCSLADQCQLVYNLVDSYGDGWNGNYINVVDVETGTVIATLTMSSGYSSSGTIDVCDGRDLEFQYVVSGGYSYPSENSWTIVDVNEEIVFEGNSPSASTSQAYTVNCTVTDCRKPTNLAAEPGPKNAVLSWTENGGSDSWIVAYKVDGSETYTEVNAGTNPYTLGSLTPETRYAVKVRPNCSDGLIKWSDEITFTTDEACPAPVVTATDITYNSANIVWNGQANYELRYCMKPEVPAYDFDDSSFDGWTTIDADGDGYTWVLGSECGGVYLAEGGSLAGSGHNGSHDLIVSGSYSNVSGVGALTPDNYLVSPQVNLGGSFSFWACGQDASYVAEHFGVAVSTLGNEDPADFVMVKEWTMTAKGTGAKMNEGTTRSGNRDQGNWYQYVVDLSNFSGMVGYVAIRHFDCTDMFMLDVDDIEIVDFDAFEWVNVNNVNSPYALTGLQAETTYMVQVRANCGSDGTSAWGNCEFTTLPSCMPPTNLAVDEVGAREATLSWTANGEENMWRIAYSTDRNFDPDQPDFFVDVRSNPATIDENLDPDQTYFAYVRATCDEEDVSAWSNMVSFTTLEACPKPTDLTITDLMPTSAVVNWSSNNEIEFEYALVPSSDKSDRDSWLYYDNGTCSGSIGTGGSDVYWAVMFPADMLNEDMLTKVSMYEASDGNNAEPITIYVYSGGENAPETLLYEETVETEQLNAFHEVTLAEPVAFDASQNLWIVLKEYGSYPAMGCADTGDPNGRWISLDGTEWEDVTTYNLNYTWMIRGYFETSINPDDLEWISAPDATTSPYTLTELDPETTYAVRIRANCGADGYSNWAMAMFTTPSACQTPSHLTVEPNATEATLSWTGYQTAYNIEYWSPAYFDESKIDSFVQLGDDVTTGAILTQYSFDLSNFSGTGAIAIRHYNVSDMFRLNIDDITVTDANGQAVVTYDFEDGTIPTSWVNYDADGDGNVWGIWNITQTDGSGNPVGNGSYCLTSASYASGILYPDNWLILPDVPLGGTLTFVARGQDPSYAAEVFGVFVTTEQVVAAASEPEFIEAVTDNPYVLDNLTPNTPYEVHVQGICTKTELTDWTNTVSFTTLNNCAVPTIDDITDVTANSATVEWTGAQDSYNLQYYIPGGFNEDVFTQVGEDETATEELTEYTFDLSQFSGTGSVAIRHYNITDMFRLLVDDIVLTDAGGNEIFNVDFEGDIPSNLMIVDHDGDGYNWELADYTGETDYEPGTYFNGYAGVYSASYVNNYGPLYPDNWLIIDGVELGGTLTFVARGQDPSYAAEVFGVFVTTEEYISDDSEPVLVEGVTSPYTITDLDPSTIYAVQVQGLCEEDELTNWSQEAYFMTESACPAPSDLAFTDVTDNSAVVSWTENGDATAWQLEVINYSATGTYAIGTGDIINVTTNPYTLTGLDDNSLYVVYVYAVCGPNEVSAASNWDYFQTLEGAGEEEQTVTLSSGWGWFSSYVEYPENALELIENSIAATSTTASIKSQNDGYVNLENGAWSGTLATMNNANMYLILTDGGELSLTAPLADPNDHPITLATGWNWIGYISDAEMSADYALSTITPSEGDMIKGQNGFTSFEGGAWSTALTLTPGAGYLYLNNGETENTLIYPAPAKGYVAEIPAITHWNTNHYLFPTNLTMMVTLNAEQFAMSEGSHEIGAFVNGECRGTALLQKSMGNYVAFLTVSGEPGEEVSFRLFDVNGNTEFAGIADEQIVYQSDDIYGSAKNPMVLNFRNTGVNEYGEISLFPNPTSGKVMIQGQAIETVKVYNAMGQLLINEEVGNADQVELNLSSLSAGVYTINVTMTNGQQGNQMVVKE